MAAWACGSAAITPIGANAKPKAIQTPTTLWCACRISWTHCGPYSHLKLEDRDSPKAEVALTQRSRRFQKASSIMRATCSGLTAVVPRARSGREVRFGLFAIESSQQQLRRCPLCIGYDKLATAQAPAIACSIADSAALALAPSGPPACAMSGRPPPPLPPSASEAILTRFTALKRAVRSAVTPTTTPALT